MPDAHAQPTNGVTILRGARIRWAAVRVLAANADAEAPVQYHDCSSC